MSRRTIMSIIILFIVEKLRYVNCSTYKYSPKSIVFQSIIGPFTKCGGVYFVPLLPRIPLISSRVLQKSRKSFWSTLPSMDWNTLVNQIETFLKGERENFTIKLYILKPCNILYGRICWFLFVMVGCVLSAHMCYQEWQIWDESPLLVTLDPTIATHQPLTFPSVTICSTNKVSKKKLDALLQEPKFVCTIVIFYIYLKNGIIIQQVHRDKSDPDFDNFEILDQIWFAFESRRRVSQGSKVFGRSWTWNGRCFKCTPSCHSYLRRFDSRLSLEVWVCFLWKDLFTLGYWRRDLLLF